MNTGIKRCVLLGRIMKYSHRQKSMEALEKRKRLNGRRKALPRSGDI